MEMGTEAQQVRACSNDLKGQVPMGLVALKSATTIAENYIQKELVSRIRETTGAIPCYKDTVVLASLAFRQDAALDPVQYCQRQGIHGALDYR
jgi:hypothetical protein